MVKDAVFPKKPPAEKVTKKQNAEIEKLSKMMRDVRKSLKYNIPQIYTPSFKPLKPLSVVHEKNTQQRHKEKMTINQRMLELNKKMVEISEKTSSINNKNFWIMIFMLIIAGSTLFISYETLNLNKTTTDILLASEPNLNLSVYDYGAISGADLIKHCTPPTIFN